jgi:pyruvate,water dikinase
VVLDPTRETSIAGEILVAPMTDPGWVFLMLAASGLVVERGGVLSHTAIIGRELGIPTVVAVPDATRRISDGEEIEIDGDQGTVRRAGLSGAGEDG